MAETDIGSRVAKELERRLRAAFAPLSLAIVDESASHRGHPDHRPEGGTHFAVDIVAEGFRGLSRVERERRVVAAVKDLLGAPVHALQVRARTPEEAGGEGHRVGAGKC